MQYSVNPLADTAKLHRILPVPLLAGLAVAMLLPSGFRSLDVRAQIVLGSLSVALLSLAGLRLITLVDDAAGGIAKWRVGPWYLLWGSLAFGLASITWLGPQSGSATRVELSSVVDALWVISISVVIWTAGYLVGLPQRARGIAGRGVDFLLRGTTPVFRGGAAPWVLYALGSGARIVSLLLTGRFGYVGDPSGLVSEAAPYANALRVVWSLTLFAVAAAAFRAFAYRSKADRFTLWVLFVAEIVVGALAGGKESFLLSLFAVLIPYGAVRGRINARVLVIGTLIFLWVAVPFNVAYRNLVRGEQMLSPSAAIAAAPSVLSEVVQPDSVPATLVKSFVTISYRLRDIDNVAIIMQLTPSVIPYRSPSEFAVAPLIGLVPRAVWPDKPVLATGYQFSREYYGTPSNMYTSTGITKVGDLYQHGGLAVVVAGVFLVGISCRLFDSLFHSEKDPRAICFVLVFLPMVVRTETDMQAIIFSVPTTILIATLGVRLAFRPVSASGEHNG